MELGNLIFGNSRGEFPVNRDWQDMFIEHLYQLGFDGYGMPNEVDRNGKSPVDYMEKQIVSSTGEKFYKYENDVFSIMPYYWGDDDEICELPNFKHKPTGFELSWYKYALRDSYMNQDLSKEELELMLKNCVTSMKTGKGKAV